MTDEVASKRARTAPKEFVQSPVQPAKITRGRGRGAKSRGGSTKKTVNDTPITLESYSVALDERRDTPDEELLPWS